MLDRRLHTLPVRLTPAGSDALRAFLGDPLRVPTLRESSYRVHRSTHALAHLGAQGSYVGHVSVEQGSVCTEDVPRVPSLVQRLTIYQEGFRVGLLEVGDAQDHGLYLGLYVVGLVDHVVDARALLGLHQLHIDQEELKRVDG